MSHCKSDGLPDQAGNDSKPAEARTKEKARLNRRAF
jgi:hypothetical protein